MSIELKPCPFCGGKAEKFAQEMQGIRVIAITCKSCGAAGPMYRTKNPRVKDDENPAIAGWNRRTK